MPVTVPELKGDIAAFDTAIAAVTAQISDFESAKSALTSHFGSLTQQWTSPSAQSATELQQALAARAQTLQNRLEEALEKLRGTRSNYQRVLDRNSSMLGA